MPDDLSHLAVVDRRQSEPRAFTDEREVVAALDMLRMDAAEILRRCCVGKERQPYLSETITEFVRIAYVDWCRYQGIEPREW